MILDQPLETELQEFKTTLSELDKGIESLTAMLNKSCKASVYFGVADNGEVLGLKGQLGKETIRKVEQRITEYVKPAIVPSIALEEYDGKAVIHVTASGNRRPYSCAGNYRIRIGSSNKQIDPELLGELFYSSQNVALENTESINQNLTFNMLRQLYISKGMSIENTSFELNAGLKVGDKYNCLAALLADENDISIKVVRFKGTDKLKMISRNEYGFKCLIIAMEQASSYVSSLNETRVDLESGLIRKEIQLFDTHAFEEAWTNACLHNKWIKNIPPAIYIFDDRIEIISTGGLPFDFSKEDFYKGVSHPVNAGLQRIMVQLGIVEQTGHGNLVIVSKYGREAFDIQDSHITVTIPFAFVPSMVEVGTEGLLPTKIKVLNNIKNNPTKNIREIAALSGIGISRTNEIISELKALGKIERIGGNKGGYWKVI